MSDFRPAWRRSTFRCQNFLRSLLHDKAALDGEAFGRFAPAKYVANNLALDSSAAVVMARGVSLIIVACLTKHAQVHGVVDVGRDVRLSRFP